MQGSTRFLAASLADTIAGEYVGHPTAQCSKPNEEAVAQWMKATSSISAFIELELTGTSRLYGMSDSPGIDWQKWRIYSARYPTLSGKSGLVNNMMLARHADTLVPIVTMPWLYARSRRLYTHRTHRGSPDAALRTQQYLCSTPSLLVESIRSPCHDLDAMSVGPL